MIAVYGFLKQNEEKIQAGAENGDPVCDRILHVFGQHMDHPEDRHYQQLLHAVVEEYTKKEEL